MFISLIYVSRSLIPRRAQDGEMANLVSHATARNERLGVRGALLFTENHFAQLLEGPETAVEEVMESIIQDPRHDQITIIERKAIDGYRFPDWSLAYWGDASYMDRKIATVLHKQDAVDKAGQTSQLFELIQRMAQESSDQKAPIGRPSKD